LTNQKQEFPMAAMFVNESGQNEHLLQYFDIISKTNFSHRKKYNSSETNLYYI